MSRRRRHDGGEVGGGSTWLKSPRVPPRAQQVHTLRCIPDAWGEPKWYDYIHPTSRIVRLDCETKEDRPITVSEYAQRLRERGYLVVVESAEGGAEEG